MLPYAALPLRADWWAAGSENTDALTALNAWPTTSTINNPLYPAEHMPPAAPGFAWYRLADNTRWHQREPTLLEQMRDRDAPRQWVKSEDTAYLLLQPDEARQLFDTRRHVKELAQISVEHPPAPAQDAPDAEWQRYVTLTEDARNRDLALNELRWKLARSYQTLIQSFTNLTASRLGKPPVFKPG